MKLSLVTGVLVIGAFTVGCASPGAGTCVRTAGNVTGEAEIAGITTVTGAATTAANRRDNAVSDPALQTWGAPDEDEDYGF
jgi:hypothetical protein